jgi:hypothetical protein
LFHPATVRQELAREIPELAALAAGELDAKGVMTGEAAAAVPAEPVGATA